MVQATEPGLDILQTCGELASYQVNDIQLESVTVVWTSVLALKIPGAQLAEYCNYTTFIFGNEEPEFTLAGCYQR